MNLISLMIGCAVAAILATLAMASQVPQMQRAQVRQAIADLAVIRSDIGATLTACNGTPAGLTLSTLQHYPLPTVCNAPGPAPAYVQGGRNGSYVSALTLNGLTLTAVLGGSAQPGLRGKTIGMVGTVYNGAVSWACSGPAGMVPAAC